MEQPELHSMQIRFAGDIRKNADRLVSLVNDIMRLSEMEQISLTLEGSDCEIMANRGIPEEPDWVFLL